MNGGLRSTNFMYRMSRPFNDTEIYIKGSIDLNTVPNEPTLLLTYEVAVIKPGEMTTQSIKSPTFQPFYTYQFSVPQPIVPNARIYTIVDDRYFYYCWSLNNVTVLNVLPCNFIDVFEFNRAKFIASPNDPPSTYLRLVRRDFGSFLSVNFDFDERTGMITRMVGYQ